MELTVKIDIPEDKIKVSLLDKIQNLEDEISFQRQQSFKYEKLCRDIIRTQFPQYWFGNRNGMNISEVFEHLSKVKVTKTNE